MVSITGQRVGSRGHSVCFGGHTVSSSGQRVSSGGHLVISEGHRVSVAGHCVNATGDSVWQYQTDTALDDDVHSSPCVADLDDDGSYEVLVGSYNNSLHCVNATGDLVWQYQTGDDVHSPPVRRT